MRGKQGLWEILAHLGIIVGMMVLVFFVIDRFNPAMEFLTSEISKWLILILALSAVGSGLFSAVLLFQMHRRQEERTRARHEAASIRPTYAPRVRAEMDYAAPRETAASVRTAPLYPREAMAQRPVYGAPSGYRQPGAPARR